jgi:hypothetical protein
MPNMKRYRTAEQELLTRLADTVRSGSSPAVEHPSHTELRRFARGRVKDEVQTDRLWAHLADCNSCIHTMSQIRIRAIWMRRATVAICTVVLLAAVLWVWRGPQQIVNHQTTAAVLDLRSLSPTRGPEKPAYTSPPAVSRTVSELSIILPAGSEGAYDVEVVSTDISHSPLLDASGHAYPQRDSVDLEIKLNISGFSPGKYFLALRRNSSDWEYYPIKIE